MQIEEYIANQPLERQNILTALHQVILENDQTVKAEIEPMMGKEMILYKARGMMKYALSSVKNGMSLHVLPIYMNPVLHQKYKELMPLASFQKGCINFNEAAELPLPTAQQLIKECESIDLVKIREDQLAERKAAKMKKK